MQELIFATNNRHKLQELEYMFQRSGLKLKLITLADAGLSGDIPEEHETLEGNALAKAEWVFSRLKLPVFADDTGLEINALDGRPGVYSARYAGEGCSFEDNVNKVLLELKGNEHRSARFRSVIALILADGSRHFFEGIVDGEIMDSPSGMHGFGYDPVFKPSGCHQSFAEMSPDLKNAISHRAKAFEGMMRFLKHQQNNI